MEIRGIRDVRDLELLLAVVKDKMEQLAIGGIVTTTSAEQLEALEQLNGVANALQEAIREAGNTGEDFGWTMVE